MAVAAILIANGYGGRCDTYCQSFGQECAAAYEESGNSCTIKQTYRCDDSITGTSDMLCKCIGAASQPSTSPPTTAAPTSGPQPGSSCKDFSQWPAVQDGVTCGKDSCMALVATAGYGGRCDTYCQWLWRSLRYLLSELWAGVRCSLRGEWQQLHNQANIQVR
eukprot:TRINITY_DN968_c0_g1_i4.p1 TRINITY_DN968_c0_g1~~TRINITY_DN968_c0_g1_i4.p1  ORF type:complete len:163 (-),score=19.06 TRINITY_DN968_c0_g1_i4:1-489(-)